MTNLISYTELVPDLKLEISKLEGKYNKMTRRK